MKKKKQFSLSFVNETIIERNEIFFSLCLIEEGSNSHQIETVLYKCWMVLLK